MARNTKNSKPPRAEGYRHPSADSLLRLEDGSQFQFWKKKPSMTYRYDSSLASSLSWDEGHAAREVSEALICQVMGARILEEAKAAAAKLGLCPRLF